MDKLTLYEILSFLIPGFLSIVVADTVAVYVLGLTSFVVTTDFKDNLILLFASLLIGSIIHIINQNILLKYEWYKKIIAKPIRRIRFEPFVAKLIPYLNAHYAIVKQHESDDETDKNIPAKYLFDTAYHYLEVNGKISQAKNFQSLYFLFRNIFSLCLVGTFISIGIVFFGACIVQESLKENVGFNALIATVLFLLSALVIVSSANWFRMKMIERVFGNYYADIIHKNINQSNRPKSIHYGK